MTVFRLSTRGIIQITLSTKNRNNITESEKVAQIFQNISTKFYDINCYKHYTIINTFR